jgi:amino acid adenylation domain-containing protein
MQVSYAEELAAPAAGPEAGAAEEVYLLPVSFAQQRLWFLSRFQPTSPYNLFGAFTLSGDLRLDVLARCLDEIVARHEILRTTFSIMDGEPMQVVARAGRLTLPRIDMGALPEAARQAEVDRVSRAQAARPFDLTRGPLLRLFLFRVSARRHVLLYVMHHIVTDGWSEAVLLREVATLYQAFRAGQPSPLPDLPIQYGDFASWQRDWLQGEVLENLLGFWKQQLAGAPVVLDLPTDHPRPAVFTNRGASVTAEVPAALARELAALGQQEEATPFMTLLAAFGVLLGRHAGQRDVLIGSPVSNRDQVELEELIGLFLNTLVLRVEMSGDPTFRELLARVREMTYGAQEHRDLPFERLIAALGLGRDQSRNPLFQAFFNLEAAGRGGRVDLADLSLEPAGVAANTAKFDLLLNVRELGNGLSIFLEYCSDLFAEESVRRLLDHFLVLLGGIAADPDRRVSELPLLTEAELAQVLSAWNATGRDDLPRGVCLHELLAESARQHAQAVAVTCRGEEITFQELDRRADQLGHHLRSLGVGPDVPVGLSMTASIDLVVGILGILKAGGAYLPIDPAYPASRIAFLVADAGLKTIVTHELYRPLLGDLGPRLVCLDGVAAQLAAGGGGGGGPVPGGAAPDNLAYVIYTSGSTGRPKGVMVPHRGVVNYLSWAVAAYAVAEGGGAPLHSSIGFDLSVTSLFSPLLAGRPVTLVAEERGAEQLTAALAGGHRFSFVKLTPAHLELVNRRLAPAAAAAGSRALVLGGEALLGRSLGFWRDNAPATRLINEYGPTETVVGCVVHEVAPGQPIPVDVPIGGPIANTRAYLLSPELQPVPVGVVGELHVGGIQVTRGYLRRPDLTAERFVPDPFATAPGQRLYRTGDLARYRHDGVIRLVGRVDDQVKVHGFRIEPAEIEAVLATHPAVAAAAVTVHRSEGEKRLVAYLVAAGAEKPSADELRTFLLSRLPAYMVPAAFLLLAEMPLTLHGKVDRAALPAPGAERPALEQEYVPPRTLVEDALATVWASALGLDRVGVRDNFFTLGGDSILSIQVVALAKARGLHFGLQDVFRFPTVEQLARHIQAGEEGEDVHTAPLSLLSPEDRRRLPDDVEDAYPLSGLQQGMLFHIQQMAGAPVFHSINSYYLRFPFDATAFQRAVDHVTARHANLRTSFDLSAFSEPLQLVHATPYFPVEVHDVRHLDPAGQDRVLDEFWAAELVRPFDLTRAPQLRFAIHWRSESTFQFSLTENHAVIDGWSLHNLYDELLTCYSALLKGEDVPALPPLTTTFRDFIHLERKALESLETREFWERRLDGCTVLKVPRQGQLEEADGRRRCTRYDIGLPGELTEGLRGLARREAIPLKSVLLAAHLRVMGFLSGQRDVITGLSSNGRPETLDGQRIGGLFLNTLPVRLDLAGGTWRELARQVFELELQMMPHRRYPLSAIQARWGRETLLETSFVYLNFHVMEDIVRNRKMEAVGAGTFIEETAFVIMTAFQHSFTSPVLLLNVTYDQTVLSAEQMAAINEYYLATLEAMVGDPHGRYEAFSPLTEGERRQLLVDWNERRPGAPAGRLVHDRFAEQARRHPDRPCVRWEGEALTFAAVESRANRLAHALAARRIGPELRVALCLDRSPDMVVALLAVLKAGGAYVPMDPEFPAARLEQTVADSAASLVVTRKRWRARLAGGAPVLCLDAAADRAEIAAEDDRPPAGGAGPQNLAYVIYTSGSTGQAKGVAVEHRQLAAYVSAIEERLGLPAAASYAMVSTFAADLGNTVLFRSLCGGGELHLVSEERAKDPAALGDLLGEHPADCLKIVPSHLSALLDGPDPARWLPRRRLVVGGEAADWQLVERVRELVPACRILHHYGPTETTVGVLTQELDARGCAENTEKPPLGRPLGDSSVYLLDAHLQLVPPGAPGELYIGGSQVARGYAGRPEQTALRFIPDAWSGEPGARLYRSGDLARHLADGTLEFLGRIDGQVKIRGFRVEPGEVAAVLRQHGALRDAAVLVRQHGGERRLVAYAVTAPDAAVTDAELLAFLEQRLPSYMMPAALVRRSEPLPLTPNGKLDARRLPEPDGIAGRRQLVQPRNPLELQLVHVWEDLLGVEGVSVDESFFEIGGNSLLAVRLVARIRKQFGQSLPLDTLLGAPTIERLAALLGRGLPPEEPRHLVAIQPRGSRTPFFCVHPGHGSVYNYLRLSRYLGFDQPFYGLQALDLDHDGDAYVSVEELATRYLAELTEKQPQGPYLLGGWSFGGLVAFEMAQRLIRRGEEVHLSFFDVRTPTANARLASLDPELMQAYLVLEHAKMMAGATVKDLALTPHDLLGQSIDEQIDRVIRELGLESALPAELDLAMLRRYFQLRLARFAAIKNYRPRVYPGRITLFRATDVYTDTVLDEAARIFAEAAQNPTYGWEELSTEPIDLRFVPGDHESIVYEPHVQVLAEELRKYITELTLQTVAA